MRKLVPVLVLLAAGGMAAWAGLYPADWQNWLGFSKAAYFTNGQNYAFYSGIGAMGMTGLGLSTIITGLWHAHNCHEGGCWRVGRHKIDGTPWCNRHHGNARKQASATLADVVERLDALASLIEGIAAGRMGRR